MITTWKNELTRVFAGRGESWDDVEECSITEEELNRKFDSGFGCEEGSPFTVWTNSSVYFPICYDGAEWVGVVSRNPNGASTQHQGG